jgi:predicted phosphodiesterase
MRIFALSDIHVDYDSNARWLSKLSASDYQDDVLILAGDISDIPSLLEYCFKTLTRRFGQVLYVPGNHDLWVLRSQKEKTSFEKHKLVCALAESYNVLMKPFHRGTLSVIPLQGWYDYSFGVPSDELRKVWMDYRACVWPDGVGMADITRQFTDANEPWLETVNDTVISFSHFLPRIDLLPAGVPDSVKMLFPIMGSVVLEKQIRRLKSKIHVYGHSHLNRRVDIDGVSYINNALGYPHETRITKKALQCIFEH